ncbi:ComEA family DNA-binding protein [Geomonas sp.]|uniref:ComEA family DNA-binding protein n=1 Tax=Geomonas sp. TaxID=2651584 RepID=UPI002B4A03BE|nr:helix-hairpin-helix domain-containing protein [Geomonas sp.]HJV36264.1 helix-hairpin-helix domain-containing protein [Geomonas sp.]
MHHILAKGLSLCVAAMLVLSFSLVDVHAKDTGKPKPEAKAAAGGKVDINSASQAELEKLPGVGAVTAKKIIAGRPYGSTADLAKSGMSAKTIEKITPLVTVGAAPVTAPVAAPKMSAPKAQTPAAQASPKATKHVQPPPAGSGMVWVNPDSKIFHKEGSRWYGKTKQGAYMTESEAIKAGYRESKQGAK